MLAICTARVEGRRVEPRVLLHALCHYALRVKIILADFSLAVSTPIAKLPNLIPRQISGYTVLIYMQACILYGYIEVHCNKLEKWEGF